ncbi:MAG TPA: hypothetical protein VIJ34_16975 [Acidimicrobiales bacterium]
MARGRHRIGAAFAAMMATLVLLGVSLGIAVGASAASPQTPAEACAQQAKTGPVDSAFALAVCTDLVQDLTDIGNMLGMVVIQPTSSSLTTPVRVIFDASAGPPNDILETKPFVPGPDLNTRGLIGDEPCQITFYPAAYDKEKPLGSGVSPRLHVLIAHEVVHCYQNVVTNAFKAGLSAHDGFPQWVSEGSATYLATQYAGHGEDGTASYWKGWIENENKNLTLRERDAVGWYSLVAYVNHDRLWSKMADAWRAYLTGGATAYIAALGGDAPAVSSAWAPSILNLPPWGDAWTTHGTDVANGAQPQTFVGLGPGIDFDQEPIASLAAVVDDESDVDNATIEISVTSGFASVHDLTGFSEMGFKDQAFCLGTACKTTVLCPGEKASEKPVELTKPFTVAAGGGATAGTYTITKIATSTTPGTPTKIPGTAASCKPPPAPKAASSQGDPHFQALNDGTFDFQGAGEYTLVRSMSGDVNVQVRQTPYKDSKQVAFSTAVAMRVGTTKVEVDNGTQILLRIGNKVVVPAALVKKKLVGGGDLTYSGRGKGEAEVVASWPDGSSLDVFTDTVGMNITFTPPSPGVDTFSGLLTAWEVPKPGASKTALQSETLIGGSGHRYVINPTTTAGFKTLYGPFAQSWRVTPKTSLFTYAKAKSTSSYVVKGFPATFADLPAAKESSAEATCKADGVSDPKLLADCALDVGETGHTTLATAFSQSYDKVASSTSTTSTTTTTFPASSDGSVHPAKFYFANPCQVVTTAELTQALGRDVPPLTSFPPECEFIVGEVQVDFTTDPAGQYKSQYSGNGVVDPETALGPGGYCIEQPSPFPSVAIASLDSAGSFQFLADNCTEATALAKDALMHISG